MRRQPGKRALKNQVMWYICTERGILCKVDLYIICDSLIAEKGAFSRHTAVCCENALFSCAQQ